MTVREPAVAGIFYPAGATQLRQEVSALLSNAATKSGPVPKAIIVPHAGYIYSGAVAAAAYRLLTPARNDIHRVVLFGPAHRVYLDGMAVPTAKSFATPLGNVSIDQAMVGEISKLPGVYTSDAAHKDEHSLEVQLPFLQTVLEKFTLVPIVVGNCAAALVANVMDAVWGGPETLIVISSDLSHYLPYDQARLVDKNTCERILTGAAALSGDEACGANAINGLLKSTHYQQLQVEAIDVRNSGDTCGDKTRVVGYGSFALH
jgi:AmmeMemoRadiSam system protein B